MENKKGTVSSISRGVEQGAQGFAVGQEIEVKGLGKVRIESQKPTKEYRVAYVSDTTKNTYHFPMTERELKLFIDPNSKVDDLDAYAPMQPTRGNVVMFKDPERGSNEVTPFAVLREGGGHVLLIDLKGEDTFTVSREKVVVLLGDDGKPLEAKSMPEAQAIAYTWESELSKEHERELEIFSSRKSKPKK